MTIELIPAIDIIDGKCVRLTKGDYDKKTVYNEDPVLQAKEFERLGFKRLHIVDLDGAKSKHIVNDAILHSITKATDLIVDFGGGIKSEQDIEKAFSAGAHMVTIGSSLVSFHPHCHFSLGGTVWHRSCHDAVLQSRGGCSCRWL